MNNKVIISVTNDLSTDQRVHKVCLTLKNMGCSVLLVGRKLNDSVEINREYDTHRIKLIFNSGPLFYLEFNLRLFFYILFKKFDFLYSNDLDTLLPNYLISQLLNKKLVYDSHELFSELPELQKRPIVKIIWKYLESFLLPKQKYAITVSKSIADYYEKKYSIKMKVIRNVPFYVTSKKNNSLEKIIIYLGTINPGRGLELAIKSMQYLKDHKLIILGDGKHLKKLKLISKNLDLDSRINFVGKVPYENLYEYTSNANVGLLLEEPLGLSFEYSLPNKLFDYIHLELPFISSNLPEVKKIINTYKVGEILIDRSPKSLAHKIINISKVDIEKYKIAKKELCWEKEKIILESIIRPLLK